LNFEISTQVLKLKFGKNKLILDEHGEWAEAEDSDWDDSDSGETATSSSKSSKFSSKRLSMGFGKNIDLTGSSLEEESSDSLKKNRSNRMSVKLDLENIKKLNNDLLSELDSSKEKINQLENEKKKNFLQEKKKSVRMAHEKSTLSMKVENEKMAILLQLENLKQDNLNLNAKIDRMNSENTKKNEQIKNYENELKKINEIQNEINDKNNKLKSFETEDKENKEKNGKCCFKF